MGHWHGWDAFFAMGGYGLYVWGSLAMVFGCIALELVQVSLRRRALLRSLRADSGLDEASATQAVPRPAHRLVTKAAP